MDTTGIAIKFFVAFVFGYIVAIALTAYHYFEVKRIERPLKNIKDYESRSNAIYAKWRKKHPIMPYSGSDVGFFISICGICIPTALLLLIFCLLDFALK